MPFEILPIVDIIIDFYTQPRTPERFQTYLKLLQGDTEGDLILPIGNFNPMAKEHVVEKLLELKKMKAEEIIVSTLEDINKNLPKFKINLVFNVALNIADDLQGSWTHKFTTDYQSKFKFNALFVRRFCVPILFSSEDFSEELIIERTKQYCARTSFWLKNSKPKTLKEHVEQEVFVAQNSNTKEKISERVYQNLDAFYKLYQKSDRYDLIFNFFYGDEACVTLNFPTLGIEEKYAGFKYSAHQPS